jgi:GMP reductase
MNINNDAKLDFDDVLLVPQRSHAASRSLVDVKRTFKFFHSSLEWSGVPIMAANMDTTGTFEMAESLSKKNCITCLHKHYNVEDYIENLQDLNTFWYSMGISDEEVSKLRKIVDRIEDIPNICIDVANGYTDKFVDHCAKIREKFGTRPVIMAGNVCTPEMVHELILHGGVDIVKVGIGPGSACTTRLKAGVGYPQLSAINECSHAAHGLKAQHKHLGLICADGGCRTPADVVKAFAAGADFVMLGGMIAGTEECSGEWEYEYMNENGLWEKLKENQSPIDSRKLRRSNLTFYGMSSHAAQEKYGGIKNYRASEGRVKTVEYKGEVSDVIDDILGGIRSACAYVGADSIKDLPKCAEFVKVNRVHFDKTL